MPPPVAARDFLPGFERIDASAGSGSWADDSSPWRVVIHTTECSTVESAVSAYRDHNSWPHFTVDPVRDRRVQHLSLNEPSRALKNDPPGQPHKRPHTNRLRAISIEVVGFAQHGHLMNDESKLWLAQKVVRPLAEAVPVRPRFVPFFGEGAGFILAKADAQQRMTVDDWESYDGWCGHQHVPKNDHWDPGALDVAGILRMADAATPEEALTMGFIHAEVWNQQEAVLSNGRWTFFAVGSDGRVDVMNDFTTLFGPSQIWKGDLRGAALAKPITSFTQTPSGNGYYLVGADGGVFTFGDAVTFKDSQGHISLGGVPLAGPVFGIQLLQSKGAISGYVLLATDGGTFTFGTGNPRD